VADRDEQLLLLAGGGDDEAFATLARRWRPKLEAFAARTLGDAETARDAAQDALVRIWRAAGTYRPEGRFASYVYAVIRNVCL